MRCPKKHLLRPTSVLVASKHRCRVCTANIPRQATRYVCRWCRYHVCYNCSVYYAPGKTAPDFHQSESALSSGSTVASQLFSVDASLGSTHTLRSLFQAKMDAKQHRRERHVVISRFYDIVRPSDAAMRTHPHKRGSGIADDCQHASFSEAKLVLGTPAIEMFDVEDIFLGADMDKAPSDASTTTEAGKDHSEGRALAATVVAQCRRLVGLLANEVGFGRDALDGWWHPNPDGCKEGDGGLLSWLLGGRGDGTAGALLSLCAVAETVLQGQAIVSEVEAPVRIFGDIHGQLRDMLLLFHFYGAPGNEEGTDEVPVSFIFNGDFVDRGRHQLEVITILLSLKVTYPDLVWLNRGNHEDRCQNLKTTAQGHLGFNRSCEEHLGRIDGPHVFEAFQRVFDWLPLAARVNGRILVLHGGLGQGDWTLKQLAEVERPLSSEGLFAVLDGAVYNMLWSDPVQYTADNKQMPQAVFGVHRSSRAKHSDTMKVFGRDVTETFCKRERLSLIVRSHQFKNPCKGYEVMHDGWLMRVFSARNYLGRIPNDSAVLLVGHCAGSPDRLLVRPQVLERCHRPQTSHDLNQEHEPYCPKGHLMQRERPHMPKCLPVRGMQDDNIECRRCGAEELQRMHYFACRGCGSRPETSYQLCLDCASKRNAPGVNCDPEDYDDDDSSYSSGEDAGLQAPPNATVVTDACAAGTLVATVASDACASGRESAPPMEPAAQVGGAPRGAPGGAARGDLARGSSDAAQPRRGPADPQGAGQGGGRGDGRGEAVAGSDGSHGGPSGGSGHSGAGGDPDAGIIAASYFGGACGAFVELAAEPIAAGHPKEPIAAAPGGYAAATYVGLPAAAAVRGGYAGGR